MSSLRIQYPVQLRIAGTEVVDGDPGAGGTIAGNHFGELLAVATQFGDLEDDTAWVHAMLLQLFQAR